VFIRVKVAVADSPTVALKLMETLSTLTIGLDIVTVGGLVLESGGILIGLATTKLTSCVPAAADNRSTEMKATVNSVFLLTENP
jgi:hypothetical protein